MIYVSHAEKENSNWDENRLLLYKSEIRKEYLRWDQFQEYNSTLKREETVKINYSRYSIKVSLVFYISIDIRCHTYVASYNSHIRPSLLVVFPLKT